MDSDEGSVKGEQNLEILFEKIEEESSEEESMSQWTSLTKVLSMENEKKMLYNKGLYSPGSGDMCNKYLAMSDSSILRHPYYNYPAILDPGIKEALFKPEEPTIYADDGKDLYLKICSDMSQCPVRMFHRNLLSSVIDLSYYGVDPQGIRAMALALEYNKHVVKLDLTDNFLNDDASYHLGQMLSTNTTLKELILNGCRIGESGIHCLGENLCYKSCHLELLNLARNNIGDTGGAHFAILVSKGLVIKKVNLSNNKLGKETALALSEVLEWRNPFTNLDLSWNNFYHVPSTTKMLNQLANSELLQELNLSFNALEGEKVAEAIYYIFKVPTLMALDLSHNRFLGNSIDIIIPGLIYAKKLVTLNLSHNPMSPEDAYKTLQKMLRPRVKLQNLLMENVSVDKSFITLLEKVLRLKARKNFSVTYGNVLRNWIVKGPDPRELILKRAEYLGNLNKKNPFDIPLYFLELCKKSEKPIDLKSLITRLQNDNVPLSEQFICELPIVFPGPGGPKAKKLDIKALCEYIARLWPSKKVPTTPPPESESPPLLPPENVESMKKK